MSGWTLVRERARLSDTLVAACAVLLALVCLVPLFGDLQWVLPAVSAVLVVAILGASCRAIALPIPFIPLVELIGIVGTLTAIYASDEAYGKVFPTAESWDVLRALAAQGMLDAQAFSAPVPTLPDLILLAVGGAGLAALCVDTLFASVRSAMLAGIPIFVLYVGANVLQFGRGPWWTFPTPRRSAGCSSSPPTNATASGTGRRSRRRRGSAVSPRSHGASERLPSLSRWSSASSYPCEPSRSLTPGTGDGAGGGSTAEGPVLLDPLVSMRRNPHALE